MWLWGLLTAAGATPAGILHSAGISVGIGALVRGSSLGGNLEALRGRAVVIATRDQLTAALALLELDGVARRLVLCTPDLAAQHFPSVIRDAEADAWVFDDGMPKSYGDGLPIAVRATPALTSGTVERRYSHATEWILLTSGTTGAPKLVQHSLASLIAAIRPSSGSATLVWSTFYDIRRYGGLQIFMRGVSGGSLILSAPSESVGEFLARADAAGVTHISGTPSHWRRAMMSGATDCIAPQYVRLSGEIADQAILDGLRSAYPDAAVAHAFASTEGGVAFEVADGLAGFPAGMIGATGARVEMKIANDTLHIRSDGIAARYLGSSAPPLQDGDGFVDTGDRVELRDGRFHFVGRSGGVINVGGLKVHPEEVEAVINTHPWVRMSLVKARRSPITGAIVTAEVVVAEDARLEGAPPSAAAVSTELTQFCKRVLAPHKVPAVIRVVPALAVAESGKLVRSNA
jgi:acyl-coenzyme A synthetase/AMP-(fatty) acid ligase